MRSASGRPTSTVRRPRTRSRPPSAVGAEQTVRAFNLILGGLGKLVASFAADPTAPPPVAGPVGIAMQIGDTLWNYGPILTLYVAGILSANLALVNVLPFPPLDGGRMLMITLKRLFGRRISLRAEQLTYVVGMLFLFAFIIWVTGFDIIRSLTGGTPRPVSNQDSAAAASTGRPSASTSAACSSAAPIRSSCSR